MLGRFDGGRPDGFLRHADRLGCHGFCAIDEQTEARHDDDEQSEHGKRRSRGTDSRNSGHGDLNMWVSRCFSRDVPKGFFLQTLATV